MSHDYAFLLSSGWRAHSSRKRCAAFRHAGRVISPTRHANEMIKQYGMHSQTVDLMTESQISTISSIGIWSILECSAFIKCPETSIEKLRVTVRQQRKGLPMLLRNAIVRALAPSPVKCIRNARTAVSTSCFNSISFGLLRDFISNFSSTLAG